MVKVLQNHNDSFTSDYSDMKGIHLDLCTHHIYSRKDPNPSANPNVE